MPKNHLTQTNWIDLKRRLGSLIASMPIPVFLASLDKNRSGACLTLHSLEKASPDLISQTRASLAKLGISVRVKARRHQAKTLGQLESLEDIANIGANEAIVYDPSQTFIRSRALNDLVGQLQRTGEIDKVYCDTWRRTLFVLTKGTPSAEDLESLRARSQAILKVWQKLVPTGFDVTLRLCTSLPPGLRLTPADRKSRHQFTAPDWFGFLRRKSSFSLLAIALTTAYPLAASAQEVEKPSVALTQRNIFDKDDNWQALGLNATAPLGQSVSSQVQAAIGTDDYYGLAGHLFLRDENIGTLGTFGSYETMLDEEMLRFGLRGEAYINGATLGGQVGQQSGSVKDGLLLEGDVTIYPSSTFALRSGFEKSPEKSFGRGGIEWQPAFSMAPGLSIFSDAQFDSDGFDRVMLGFKLHFGSQGATLMERDRRNMGNNFIYNVSPLVSASGY